MRAIWRVFSLRTSLTLWYASATVIVLAAYATTVLVVVGHGASKGLDDRLRRDFQWVVEMAEPNADGTLAWFEGDDGSGEEDSPWLQVWSPAGRLLLRSKSAKRLSVPDSWTLASRADGRIQSLRLASLTLRILTGHAVISGEPVIIQVAASEERLARDFRELLLILLLGLPLGVAVAGLGGYAIARRALSPVDRMAERARLITAARLGDRLPVDNPQDELGRLAGVFNDVLGRLESSFAQVERFSADVSHELRTPLAAIRSVGEVGLSGDRDPSAYRHIIGSMLEEADRLGSCVNRLLELSRAEAGHVRLATDVFDVGELLTDVVTLLTVLAEEKRQALTCACAKAMQGRGDRLVLRQALINLTDNAIKYTPVGGRIHLRATPSHGGVVVDISDTGPGIAAEARSFIFDRFYRVRSERPGHAGGAGLGLSLAKRAIEINGGSLILKDTGTLGSTFRLTLPRADASPRSHVRVASYPAAAV
jgi:heavy metal sensor kinase